MKIYNISDTTGFFNRLSSCTGDVEIVSKDGTRIPLKAIGDKKNLRLLAQTYANGLIREIELSFLRPSDATMMCDYLASRKIAA